MGGRKSDTASKPDAGQEYPHCNMASHFTKIVPKTCPPITTQSLSSADDAKPKKAKNSGPTPSTMHLIFKDDLEYDSYGKDKISLQWAALL